MTKNIILSGRPLEFDPWATTFRQDFVAPSLQHGSEARSFHVLPSLNRAKGETSEMRSSFTPKVPKKVILVKIVGGQPIRTESIEHKAHIRPRRDKPLKLGISFIPTGDIFKSEMKEAFRLPPLNNHSHQRLVHFASFKSNYCSSIVLSFPSHFFAFICIIDLQAWSLRSSSVGIVDRNLMSSSFEIVGCVYLLC